jgi:hypothetical protein
MNTIVSTIYTCRLEPETSTNVVDEKIETVINQDGWLNALSLDKLTTTVRSF